MTDTMKERITRVARIAQRNARNHEDQAEAQALIDEMAALDPAEVVVAALPTLNRATTDAEQRAFADGRDAALANAAMLAHDMGHPDVRKAINRLMPDGSPHIPMDDERNASAVEAPFGFPAGMGVTVAAATTVAIDGPPVAGANVEVTRTADVDVATADTAPAPKPADPPSGVRVAKNRAELREALDAGAVPAIDLTRGKGSKR